MMRHRRGNRRSPTGPSVASSLVGDVANQSSSATPRPHVGYALTLLAATLFAINGSVSKLAIDVDGMTTLRWTQIRSTGAFFGLLVALAILRPSLLRVRRAELRNLAIYGVVGFALVQWLYLVAITRLPIGIGLILEFTAPVLIALWARFVWHEHVRRRAWYSLALVIVGLVLIAQVWHGATLDAWGMAAGFAAACALAFYYLMGDRLVAKRDAISIVCVALGFTTLFWAIVQPWWTLPFSTFGETVDAARARREPAARRVRAVDDRARCDRSVRAVDQRAAPPARDHRRHRRHVRAGCGGGDRVALAR